MVPGLGAVLGSLPPLNFGLGGSDGDATSHGGRGPVLGNYAKDGGKAMSGLDATQILMIGGMALFAIVLIKKGK